MFRALAGKSILMVSFSKRCPCSKAAFQARALSSLSARSCSRSAPLRDQRSLSLCHQHQRHHLPHRLRHRHLCDQKRSGGASRRPPSRATADPAPPFASAGALQSCLLHGPLRRREHARGRQWHRSQADAPRRLRCAAVPAGALAAGACPNAQ